MGPLDAGEWRLEPGARTAPHGNGCMDMQGKCISLSAGASLLVGVEIDLFLWQGVGTWAWG